jgi:hypothetical protein
MISAVKPDPHQTFNNVTTPVEPLRKSPPRTSPATPLRIRLRKGSASKVAGFYSATRDRVMPPLRGLLLRRRVHFANFGDVIVSMQINGVRCHSNTAIELNSPIGAFSGLNGTGKSTILQLAACAYRPAAAVRTRRYFRRDRIPNESLLRCERHRTRFLHCLRAREERPCPSSGG